MTFPKQGNYKVVCLVHENMTGVVHVLDPLAHLPFDQDDYNEQAADQGVTTCCQTTIAAMTTTVTAGGITMHGTNVTMGMTWSRVRARSRPTAAACRLSRSCALITTRSPSGRGGTVEWTNDDPVTPHTITFGTEPLNPMPPSGSVPITNDADGARHATITLSGQRAFGFIVAAPQERLFLPQSPLGVTRFRIKTVAQAGTYPYICALHDDLGMKGKIIVLP